MRIRIVAGAAVAVCALVTGCANTVAGTGSPEPAGGQAGQSQSAPSPIGADGPGSTTSDTTLTPETTTSGGPSSPGSETTANLPSVPATTAIPDTSGADTSAPDTAAPDHTKPDAIEPASSDPATTTGGTTDSGDTTAVNPADFPGTVTEYGFQTPSANIRCGISDDTAVCQIDDYTYTPPAGDCGDSGWGFNFRVSPGKPAELFCAGDVESGGPTLDYGNAINIGDVSCVSSEQGVTCLNVASGNGFRLSKAQYSLFGPGGDRPTSDGEPEPATTIPSSITGDWAGHGRGLAISGDGHGVLDYRAYRFCSDDPIPPCDEVDGNMIGAGGHIEFTLDTTVGTASASGAVTVSNDPETAVGTPITATITHGLLELSIWPDTPFCGADSPAGACGA